MTNIYLESISMAWNSIIHNKLRSFLTMLGIIIGVAAVIALMSIGYGVQERIQNNISSLGSNQITVIPGTGRRPGVRPAAGSTHSLKYKDYLAIRNLPNVTYSSPMVNSSYVVVNGNKNWNTTIYGVNLEYSKIANFSLEKGRWWTPKESEGRSRVCVIGNTVAENLFGSDDPVGKKIRIHGDPFTVIGVLASKGYSFMDQDDRILAPFTTVQERLLGIDYLRTIVLTSDNPDVLDQIQTDVTNLLRTRHGIANGQENDFSIENSQVMLQTLTSTTQTLTLFLGSVAAISLLVGGIGIMNIMLVSVTERTKEIGIRKALGATFSMIITQFLIESVTLSVTGGIIGIFAGIAASKAISSFSSLNTVITPGPIIVSFVFSVMIGLIFGLYPARKAAKLNPIDALHYE